ncbi:MAG: helix-turn-helix domain-containing protein [Candidatus Binataceae bacterium]
MLVAHFILEANKENGRRVEGVSAECVEALKAYRWPGNVRELRNVIHRAVILSKQRTISLDDLLPQFCSPDGKVECLAVPVGSSLDDVERELIGRTIEFTAGNKTLAARMLGLGVRTLYRRLERYAGSETLGMENCRSTPRRGGSRF